MATGQLEENSEGNPDFVLISSDYVPSQVRKPAIASGIENSDCIEIDFGDKNDENAESIMSLDFNTLLHQQRTRHQDESKIVDDQI